ncbi:MAG TPA: putative quinol monooxygenase [Galbitalea sp.]|jgi:quinol monooxygenase YgiN|nr:putative quinol monooxygenase [Galbitalea sp.]
MTADADPRRVLYAEFTALAGSVDHVAELLRWLTVEVRKEPGNLVFAASQKSTNPAEFFVYEEYVDEAAFAAHIGADYGARFNRSLTELIVGDGSDLTFLMPL